MSPLSGLTLTAVVIALVGGTPFAWGVFTGVAIIEILVVPAYRAGVRLQQDKPPVP